MTKSESAEAIALAERVRKVFSELRFAVFCKYDGEFSLDMTTQGGTRLRFYGETTYDVFAAATHETEKRVCVACGVPKHLNEFSKYGNTRLLRCKVCETERIVEHQKRKRKNVTVTDKVGTKRTKKVATLPIYKGLLDAVYETAADRSKKIDQNTDRDVQRIMRLVDDLAALAVAIGYSPGQVIDQTMKDKIRDYAAALFQQDESEPCPDRNGS